LGVACATHRVPRDGRGHPSFFNFSFSFFFSLYII
jgi:hypothetical protein